MGHLDHLSENVLEALNLNKDDYDKVIKILSTNSNFTEMVSELKSSSIDKIEYYLCLCNWKLLESALEDTLENYVNRNGTRLSTDEARGMIQESILNLVMFLQVVEKDNNHVIFMCLLLPIILLGITTLVPTSICLEMLIKLINFHNLSYQDILQGSGSLLQMIDPLALEKIYEKIH